MARILFQYQKTLAERVKSLRHFKKLSQEKMALEAGIDRTYASQIERGIGNPSRRSKPYWIDGHDLRDPSNASES